MKRIITLFFVIAFMSLTSTSVSASVVKEEKALDLTEVIAIIERPLNSSTSAPHLLIDPERITR